jgi:hypothetical protein
MSQNIFIDVDGTLLNCNEGVDPRAADILRQIRRKIDTEYPDSGLYLWSGAGADHARSKAVEHGIAGYFTGFAGKPDVIIDDEPSGVFPKKTIIWRGDDQWQNLMPALFTGFSPSSELTSLVSEIIESVKKTDSLYQELYGYNAVNYPIPFFGDLENAKILTLAVNPSATEFHEDRDWKREMNAAQISQRLTTYFRRWNPPAHAWFTPLETNLRRGGHSYLFDTAHIDLSPRATRGMSEFKNNPGQFLNMVQRDAQVWLPKILRLAKNAKEVRFYFKIVAQGEWPWLDDYIRENLNDVWQELQPFTRLRI